MSELYLLIKGSNNLSPLTIYVLTVAVACAAFVILESINGRFRADDFTVYYMAAKSLVMGGQPYGTVFGHSTVGTFKYSPLALFMFVPLTLFPLKAAIIINYIVLSIVVIVVIPMAGRIVLGQVFGEDRPLNSYLLLLVFLSALIHIIRELLLGNTNLLLLMMVCLGLFSHRRSRPYLAGFFFGLAIAFKPYFLILVLPLLVHRKFKAFTGLVLSMVVFFIIPAFISGWSGNINLHRAWVYSMATHNEVMVSHQTLAALVRHHLYTHAGPWLEYFFIGIAGLSYLTYGLVKNFHERAAAGSTTGDGRFVMETFILLALLPNLVVTDTQHFLLTIPLLVFLVYYIRLHLKWQLVVTYVVLILLYGGNSMDLLGREVSLWLIVSGFSGIGNLLIVGLVIYLLGQMKRRAPDINSKF